MENRFINLTANEEMEYVLLPILCGINGCVIIYENVEMTFI